MKKPGSLTFIQLRPSPETLTDVPAAKKHFEATKSLMTALSGLVGGESQAAISLELVAKENGVRYIITAPREQQAEVMHHLYATMPACELEILEHWTMFDTPGELAGATIGFTPPEGNLRNAEFTGTDPLQPLLEVLSSVPANHRLYVQLLLAPAARKSSLTAKALGTLQEGMMLGLRQAIIGGKYEPDKKDEAKPEDEDKTKNAPFRANLRVLTLGTTQVEADDLLRRTIAAYHQMTIPGKSKLQYQKPKHINPWLNTALHRQTDPKTAFLLTPNEAANLYHTPLRPRAFPQLEAIASTRLAIPENLSREGITLGFGAFREDRPPIHLAPADRLRHTYLIGQTGTGKSTLFQNAILQDMAAGEGCCFIDPHGEGIDWLLPRIPAHRAKDVILFDPSDPEALLGLNLLEWRTPHERDLLIQELIALFYKLFDPQHTGIIGPQFEHWLRNAALTITEPNVRGTLVDIPRLFTDKQFQKATVARAEHWAVKDFWNNQMAGTADFHKSEMLNYFTSKFGSFLGNSVMHQILSQRTSAFDMRTLMDKRKILLVNLSKGRLGNLNAQLLGTLIVTKIQMAAMSRADTPAENRPPFYVYIDEFQNVVTDSFAQMLSEIRKYGVGLHLAHQYVDQLPESVKQAVAGNVGTLMAFRLGHTDAQWLADHFAPLTAEDLTNIPPYHYHLRTLAGGQLTTPFTVQAPQLQTTPQPALEQALRNRVRQFVAATKPAT
ncbi:MAG: hypothetical protein JWN01_766 [Patescibacteria group bacterium]|nr:hypothetical protein [Patescibacteria group bacterium]